jgi:hypothetical protein
MKISLSRPELLNITGGITGEVFFGGCQDWFSHEWHRRAGCGPTAAANILLYLSLTRPELRPLYGYPSADKACFSAFMEEVFKFVTPGNMGLNKLCMFTGGASEFTKSKGLNVEFKEFPVSGNTDRSRPSLAELSSFIAEGLSQDSPVAFLNLTRGKVKNLHGWHWITITEAEIGERFLSAAASDEGEKKEIDLKLWYLTTRLGGGMVYLRR